VRDRTTVAFVTPQNSADPLAWSGIPYYMARALSDAGASVRAVDNLRTTNRPLTRAKKLYYRHARGQNYRPDRDPAVLRGYAAQVEAALRVVPHELVLSTGTRPIAYLRAERPVVIWTDATFAGVVDFYPEFSRLCRETLRDGHRAERAALANCRLAIFSSEWAARSAIEDYDADPARVAVVPFGANMDWNPPPEELPAIIAARDSANMRLLFVGVDWHRKGGDVALAVAEALIRRGMAVELHVVGATPPAAPDWVHRHGLVSKGEAAGRRLLDQLYRDCHYLLLPSRADCSPIVLNEAGAYGLPAVTSDVGGILTIMRDDVNGRAFPPEAAPDDYAGYLMSRFELGQYQVLAASTYDHYGARLNWATAVETVVGLLRERL
jgi:glycosyltransferase involved in cell wall biosynthesis